MCSVRLLFSALEATYHCSLCADFVLYRVLQQERNRVRTVHHEVSSASKYNIIHNYLARNRDSGTTMIVSQMYLYGRYGQLQ